MELKQNVKEMPAEEKEDKKYKIVLHKVIKQKVYTLGIRWTQSYFILCKSIG
jgi:hypothetical protein